MCGIAGFHLKRPEAVRDPRGMERMADELVTRIEARGRQATGLVAVTDKFRCSLDKRPLNASEFIKVRNKLPQGTRTLLLHTRFATQGSNENNSNLHPVVNGSCFLTHNGSIVNDDALFAEHDLKRSAEVDTEIIPALINKFGWEKAGEAFHELDGSYAVAAIDPVKHPGKLLLARGESSPLYVYETKSFIVWASTQSAVRDAWGAVIGTPPSWKSIHYFDEGELWYVEGGDVKRTTFEVARPFRQTSFAPTRTATDSRTKAGGGSTARSSFTRGIIKNRVEAVKALRNAGYGVAEVHDHSDVNQRNRVLNRKDVTTIIWSKCYGCSELILDADIRRLDGEGNVCIDCHHIANRDKQVTFAVDANTKSTLEDWVGKEAVAHGLALERVEKRTNLSVDVIEYLIFRVGERYLEQKPTMADIAKNLDTMYQEYLVEEWDGLLDEGDGDGSLDAAFERAVQKDDAADDTIVNSPTVHCDACKKFKKKDSSCRWCEKKDKIEVKGSEDDTRVRAKCWCGEAIQVRIGNAAGFCKQHYEKCNVEDCQFGPHVDGKRVDGPGIANHLRKDGKRVCHFHARGESGVWSDTYIKKAGFHIIETVGEPGGL